MSSEFEGQLSRADIRQFVKERANGLCEYCLVPLDYCPDPFSVEHIIPKSKGGGDGVENLALSCHGCNGSKHSATEATDYLTLESVPLFHPRKDQWADHFSWSADFTEVVPLSAVGRATVHRLKLNRVNVVNFRQLLLRSNLHPPDFSAEQ